MNSTNPSKHLGILSLLRGDNFLCVNRPLARKIGLLETIFLSDLCSKYEYHRDREELTTINGKDGYFYACIDDMQERTTLCRATQDSCIKKLNLLGLVSYVVKGMPPKRYFKINVDRILELFYVKEISPNLLDPANQFVGSSKLICPNQQINLLKSANPIIRNTRSDIRDQKETTIASPKPDNIVVIFSSLDKLKISGPLKKKLSAKYTESQIDLAVERTLKWKGRSSDEVGLQTALKNQDSWTDTSSEEETAEVNRNYLKRLQRFDLKQVAGMQCVVGCDYIEFAAGMRYDRYDITDKEFIEKVRPYVNVKP